MGKALACWLPRCLAAGAACLLPDVSLIQTSTKSTHTCHSHIFLLTGCQLTHPPTYPATLLCLATCRCA